MKKLFARSSSCLLAIIAFASLAPTAFAQAVATSGKPIDKLGAFLSQFIDLIDNVLVPILFALAFIVFIYGIFQYFILGGANEEKRDTGKQLMVWGFVGFFIMVSVWGIVNLLVASTGLGGDTRPDLPTFNQKSGTTQTAPPTASGLPTQFDNAFDCRSDGIPCVGGEICRSDGKCR